MNGRFRGRRGWGGLFSVGSCGLARQERFRCDLLEVDVHRQGCLCYLGLRHAALEG